MNYCYYCCFVLISHLEVSQQDGLVYVKGSSLFIQESSNVVKLGKMICAIVDNLVFLKNQGYELKRGLIIDYQLSPIDLDCHLKNLILLNHTK